MTRDRAEPSIIPMRAAPKEQPKTIEAIANELIGGTTLLFCLQVEQRFSPDDGPVNGEAGRIGNARGRS